MDGEVIPGSDWWRDVILTADWSQVRPIHTQRIPANVKDVIIGDINGDGSMELVISLTDRVVRTYKVKKPLRIPPSYFILYYHLLLLPVGEQLQPDAPALAQPRQQGGGRPPGLHQQVGVRLADRHRQVSSDWSEYWPLIGLNSDV